MDTKWRYNKAGIWAIVVVSATVFLVFAFGMRGYQLVGAWKGYESGTLVNVRIHKDWRTGEFTASWRYPKYGSAYSDMGRTFYKHGVLISMMTLAPINPDKDNKTRPGKLAMHYLSDTDRIAMGWESSKRKEPLVLLTRQ